MKHTGVWEKNWFTILNLLNPICYCKDMGYYDILLNCRQHTSMKPSFYNDIHFALTKATANINVNFFATILFYHIITSNLHLRLAVFDFCLHYLF